MSLGPVGFMRTKVQQYVYKQREQRPEVEETFMPFHTTERDTSKGVRRITGSLSLARKMTGETLDVGIIP